MESPLFNVSHRIPAPDFELMARTTTFPRDVGLPGRVWASAQPTWIPDVVKESTVPRASAAQKERLHKPVDPTPVVGLVLTVLRLTN